MDKVTFQRTAVPGEQAVLDTILTHYQSRIQGKTVALKVTMDGRITTLDLVGLEQTDRPSGIILDTIRMFMRRLFASLDLQFPKKGDAQGKPWKQRGASLALELMTRFGTAGGTRLEHQLDSISGEGIRITSAGRGSVASGETLEAGTGAMIQITTTG